MSHRRLRTFLALGVLLHLLVAGWFAAVRPLDGDEGYYGLAAQLVAEGRTPYVDFFYPQAPLLPHVYAPGAALLGVSELPDLRSLSVLLSVLTLAMVANWLLRAHASRPGAALTALLLLALSPELLTWNVTIKTFAWANLGVFASLWALDRAARSDTRRMAWLVGGGLAVGLAASSRLLYAPAALVPAAWLVLRRRRRDPRGAAAWVVGLAIGLVPVWIAMVRDPDVFWFNNLVYHQLRFSPLENLPAWRRVPAAVAVLLRSVATNPGLLLLTGLALWNRHSDNDAANPPALLETPALLMAVTLTVTCLLPDPVHMQYFTGGLPILLLPAAAGGLARLPGSAPGRWRLAAGVLAPAVCAFSLLVIRHDLHSEPQWRLDHYRAESQRLAALTDPDDIVFSFWPGYVVGAGRRPFPGMENHFAVGVSERLNTLQRRRYRIAGKDEMAAAFRMEIPTVTVLGAWMSDLNTALDDRDTKELLGIFKRHYSFLEERDGVKFCIRSKELKR